MDANLQLAIALSLADQDEKNEKDKNLLVLLQVYERDRWSLNRPDKHAPVTPSPGVVKQLNTLNQFHETFLPSIKDFQAARAICGYMVMAHAVLLSKFLPDSGIRTTSDLNNIHRLLQDVDIVLPEVRKSMDFVFNCRKQRTITHRKDFKNRKERKKYLHAWVANYEISDYFRNRRKEVAPFVNFLRYNQFPELDISSHEEKERILLEEKPFGGKPSEKKDERKYSEDESVFILECFYPKRELLTPEGYTKKEGVMKSNRVFVLDTKGHFAIAAGARLDGKDVLIVFNTTAGNLISSGAAMLSATAAFDSCFPNLMLEGNEPAKVKLPCL